jgi:hypothetical protein
VVLDQDPEREEAGVDEQAGLFEVAVDGIALRASARLKPERDALLGLRI